MREVLRHAGDGSGYECQEDEGAFMRLSCCCTTVQFFRLDQYSFRICLHLDIVRKCSWLRAYAACVFLGLPAEAYATTYKLSQRILVLLPGVFVELIFGSAVLLAALDAC